MCVDLYSCAIKRVERKQGKLDELHMRSHTNSSQNVLIIFETDPNGVQSQNGLHQRFQSIEISQNLYFRQFDDQYVEQASR